MKYYLSSLLAVLTTLSSYAVEIGDKAPALKLEKWINGQAVDPSQPDDKTIYVVEFWATWCPPCRKSIPHLNELQAQYKDKNVVIIGISYESPEKVRAFAEKMQMQYHVAVDPEGTTAETYMAGVQGIPHAVVVSQKGTVVWSGHPMDGLDKVLQEVVSQRDAALTPKM